VTAARAITTPPRARHTEPEDDMSRLAAVIERVPGISDSYDAAPLAGGLTNRNYRVVAGSRQMVVRLTSPQTELLAIDRDAEHANALAAATAGVAPDVLLYAPDLGALVIDWIDGETLTAADLDDSATLVRVADTCRQLHAGPRFTGEFDMFALQRRYLDLVLSHGYRLPASYLDFMPQVNAMREAFAVHAPPSVPCHNDLLAANIMRSAGRLWFIDYEYSGNGDPCFELGNIASEARLPDDRLAELVTAYFGAATRGQLARASLFGLMSDYGWTLWAAIQDATSELEFDFWGWGMEKYERALERFRGPDLTQLISQVQEP
jgi:thiamine kinase-like enzyme